MFKHAHMAATIKTLTGDVNIIIIPLQAVLWETPGLIPHLQISTFLMAAVTPHSLLQQVSTLTFHNNCPASAGGARQRAQKSLMDSDVTQCTAEGKPTF